MIYIYLCILLSVSSNLYLFRETIRIYESVALYIDTPNSCRSFTIILVFVFLFFFVFGFYEAVMKIIISRYWIYIVSYKFLFILGILYELNLMTVYLCVSEPLSYIYVFVLSICMYMLCKKNGVKSCSDKKVNSSYWMPLHDRLFYTPIESKQLVPLSHPDYMSVCLFVKINFVWMIFYRILFGCFITLFYSLLNIWFEFFPFTAKK